MHDIILIGSADDLLRLRELGEKYGGGKLQAVVLGGNDRQESVRLGLEAALSSDYIVVHDGARPCVTPALIEKVLNAAVYVAGCATLATPVSDSLVKSGPNWHSSPQAGQINLFNERVSRDGLWAVQTPQAFHAQGLRRAHEKAAEVGFAATDDTAVYQKFCGPAPSGYLVVGSPENIKVTRPEDVAIVEAVLGMRQSAPPPSSSAKTPAFRIGYGYDVHPFAPAGDGRTLFLGGVAFPEHDQALAGHSDADVLLHALCDALLGAAGLPDIGHFFPPSDNAHKNRPSIEFLTEVAARLRENHWRVGNVDMTVIAEFPKINPRTSEMKAKIGVVLKVSPAEVGIKATTSEGLGFIGRGEGIAAHATVLLTRP